MNHAECVQKKIAVGAPLPGEGELSIAVDIFVPPAMVSPAIVLFCQPGGALTKDYFNLRLDDGDYAFSFAQFMAARGFITITIDHLGIGASSKPRDGFALTPDVLIAANARVVIDVCKMLRAGTLAETLPPLDEFVSIGVGHSMGAMLTAMQQARYRNYAAIALLGFSTNGLQEYLPEPAHPYINDAAGSRANIERIARAAGNDPYPQLAIAEGSSAREIYGGGADRRAVAALATARSHLLAVAGTFSMIPGSTSPDCASIEVPVFLGIGDRDICGPTHAVPASFSASHDVTLLILPQTGHSHFLFVSCARLYARLADWARRVQSIG